MGSIVIQGTVRGNITAKRSVEIHSPGRVRGNINTPSLFVERGVFFDGHCQMDASSTSGDVGPAPRHQEVVRLECTCALEPEQHPRLQHLDRAPPP